MSHYEFFTNLIQLTSITLPNTVHILLFFIAINNIQNLRLICNKNQKILFSISFRCLLSAVRRLKITLSKTPEFFVARSDWEGLEA